MRFDSSGEAGGLLHRCGKKKRARPARAGDKSVLSSVGALWA